MHRLPGREGALRPLLIRAILIVALALVLLVPFIPGLDNKPVAEDFSLSPAEYLTGADIRPLISASLAFLHRLAGPPWVSPLPYHLFSLPFHALSVICLFSI